VVDSYLKPDGQWYLPDPEPSSDRTMPVYGSLQAALARFRFAPPQPCENLFIADHIARASVKVVPPSDRQEAGWTWRFDPRLAQGRPRVPVSSCLAMPRSPLAFIVGARSPLTNATVRNFVQGTAPPGTPWIAIPDSNHHVLVDQPLALVAALTALFESWPAPLPAADPIIV
jgi:pimeloyl-ACP methyl ester carboxylesterase